MDDERARSTVFDEEIKKWDDFYRNAPENLETTGVKEFGVDFAKQVEAFLPPGSHVLEAGCGAGLQSLALARTKKYHISLMDFSSEALKYARGLFEREKLEADFLQGNVIEKGEAQYDLVFNAGSIEHYTFQEQVNYLEGIASRSKRYVLALVPNHYSYWYWIWRIKSASKEDWPLGKEAPPFDLRKAFEQAGLTCLAEMFLGENWAGGFIDALCQDYPVLRGIIHQAHRSPVIPKAQKSYFLAFLGSTSPQDRESLSSFKARPGTDLNPSLPEAISSISDALSLAISESHKNKMLTEELTRLRPDLSALDVKWKQAEAASQAHHQHAQEAGRAFEAATTELGQVKASVAEREKQLLEKTASEMDSLKTRLTDAQVNLKREESKSEETQRRLVETEKQLAETQVQLQSVLDDKTLAEQQLSQHQKQLNNITTSDFWKLATRYYSIRDNFPPARYAHRTLRSLKKRYQTMRRRGEPPAQPENQIAPAPSPALPVHVTSAAAHPMRPDCCGLKPGLVSVVLPVFNQAYLLSEAIDSVLAQTYGHFELIVVNDGSTDGVEAVLERYLGHPKVRCFTQVNQKLSKALSNGFGHASGEFWTWTSADNIMGPRMLELLVARMQADPTLGMVYADYHAIDDRGALLKDTSWRAHNRPDPPSGEIRLPHNVDTLNTIQDNFIGPCFMYRGWIGRCLGDYDPQLGVEDYDYWMRINAFFAIRHLGSDALLYRYRVHDNTLSAQAHEHRIYEKVHQLMEVERKRANFYRARLRYKADPTGKDWLVANGVPPHEIQSFNQSLPTDGVRNEIASDLLVLSSETAAGHVDQLLDVAKPLSVIFSEGDTSYQKLHRLLSRAGCLALVPDKVGADRVRLVSPCPMLDLASSFAFQGMFAFAKNYLFFSETRTPDELRRTPPLIITKPAGRHILLQVGNFKQGGMENVVIDLALSLQDEGFQVTIGNLGESGDAVNKARERGLRVESIAGGVSEEAYLSWLSKQRVDLVNAHFSIFGATPCAAAGIPFVETIHNSYVWFDPETIRKYQEADSSVTSYICVSNTAAQYADVVLGLDVSKMRVVPNGIDTDSIDAAKFEANRASMRSSWKVGPQAPVFINVASIIPSKAQLPLVKAFAIVASALPDARLILLGEAGEEPYRQAIEKAVDQLGLREKVIFAGYDREVAKYYQGADVFVLPSYWEGWSLSLAEAMANGLSGVITNVGSAYEFEGSSKVEIVQAPFGDVTAITYRNLSDFVFGEDAEFERRLTVAMIRAAAKPRGSIDAALAKRLDRRIAYRTYAAIFAKM